MITEEKQSTVASAPGPPRRRGRPLAIIGATVLITCAAAWAVKVYWWGPNHDEQVYEDATIQQLKSMAGQQPDNPRLLYWLGIRLESHRDKQGAFNSLSHAASLAKNDEQIWIASAGAANGVSGPTAAFKVMDDYLKQHPGSKNMTKERSMLISSLQHAADDLSSHKHYDQGINYYKVLLAEDPTSDAAKQGLDKALKAQASQKPAKL